MNRALITVLFILLLMPVSVQAGENYTQAEQLPLTDVVEDVPQAEGLLPDNTIDEDNITTSDFKPKKNFQPVADKVSAIPYKKPVSKRKIAFKFLAAMGGVALSSLVIFLLLTVYNRIREGFVAPIKTPDGETSLETPDDIESAVRTFLNKTKWL